MSKLTITADLKRQIEGLREATDLVDEAGRALFRFLPLEDLERLSKPASEEELRRRLANNERTYTTAEVIRHLESL